MVPGFASRGLSAQPLHRTHVGTMAKNAEGQLVVTHVQLEARHAL